MIPLLISHIISEIIFQSEWLSYNKTLKGLDGLIKCVLHVILSTLLLTVFLEYAKINYTDLQIIIISILHFILDRYFLVERLLILVETCPTELKKFLIEMLVIISIFKGVLHI